MSINEALSELQLHRPVTFHDIRKAYRKLAMQYHPDINGGSSAQFIRIEQASKFLLSKTESEINHISGFKIAPKGGRGPIIIPDSLLFGDAENLFYIGHYLYNTKLIKPVFHFIYHLAFLPKQASNLLKLLQIVLGLLFVLCIFPFLLATFIILTIPYLLYELFYEWVRKLYLNKVGAPLSKYSGKTIEKIIFILVRFIPAFILSTSIFISLFQFRDMVRHIIFDFFAFTTFSILTVWMMSILRDLYISLNQQDAKPHRP